MKVKITVHLTHNANTLDHIHERNVRTVPLIVPLQIGHFLREGAQSLHTTR